MSQRKPILPPDLTPNPAFSPAIQVGELLFVSGQVAQDNNGKTVGVGDCEAQTQHVMSRIRTIVEAAGATMQDVVKITTFLTDIANYPAFSKVRGETFPASPPASSTVIVAGLVRPEFLVEVEAVVHIPG
ncbi:MAG: RidA family protein [Chloroflexi bacterium]|nr:RidA family protein [Chloroflexota bacterium]MDA1219873.1 RidA family protein [Chloroflexota bacterium]